MTEYSKDHAPTTTASPDSDVRLVKLGFESSEHLDALRNECNFSAQVLRGVETIGCAYNPFGKYASSEGLKSIFDWQKGDWGVVTLRSGTDTPKTYRKPTIIEFQEVSDLVYEEVSGDSFSTFHREFSEKVKIGGEFLLFSGSLGLEFSSEKVSSQSYAFSRVQLDAKCFLLSIPGFKFKNLRELLQEEFRKELDGLGANDSDARKLFDSYGSHFLTGIVMGGRVVCSCATDTSKFKLSSRVGEFAEFSLKRKLGRLEAENQEQEKTNLELFENNSEIKYDVSGGLFRDASGILQGNGSSFVAWSRSVQDGELQAFIDFSGDLPMQPMWTLFNQTDPQEVAKADHFKKFFETTWGPEKSGGTEYVDKLQIISGKKIEDCHATGGYEKIDYDLNAKTKKHELYLYLCYHKANYIPGRENPKCITDIKICNNGSNPNFTPPNGYTLLTDSLGNRFDLNAGAGGDFIYLCYQESDFDESKAIKRLEVKGGTDSNIPASYGFNVARGFDNVPTDLNGGARGEWIYLFYSTTDKT